MNNKFFATGVCLVLALLMLTSCSKENDYSPVEASTEACVIRVECLGTDGRSLLTNRDFVNSISIVGNSSHSNLKFEVEGTGEYRYLVFKADIPDSGAMEWGSDRREAKGMSKLTLHFGKQKVEMSCMFRFTPNRAPVAAGGSLTLEEVSYNHRTVQRSGRQVSLTVRMDRNGKFN